MSITRGIALLSGPPPEYQIRETSCRKCDKEFSLVFQRSTKCNHCGYSYCSNCSNFQALMPRDHGYDPVAVCAFCMEVLALTAASKNYLRTLPLSKLKKYVDVYNIKADHVFEKEDLVEVMIAARGPSGCLPPANENYYRKYSVPNRSSARPRGLFNRNGPSSSPPTSRPQQPSASAHRFPRPDIEHMPPQPPRHSRPTDPNQSRATPPPRQPRPDVSTPSPRPQPVYETRPPPMHDNRRPARSPPSSIPLRPHQAPPPTQTSSSYNQDIPTLNAQPRPRAASAGHSESPPILSLERLMEMAPEDISSLPISVLKSILFQNHVNARSLIEKSELVDKVNVLIEEERRQRQRDAAFREREEELERERQREISEQREAERRSREEHFSLPDIHRTAALSELISDSTTAPLTTELTIDEIMTTSEESSPLSPLPPPPPPKQRRPVISTLERNGLCVICQDEEANIAIVDCGHLAMCRGCSDLIMTSTRECPLCRTRIVTEARLLRIFKA